MKLPTLGAPEHKHLVDYVYLLRYKTERPSAISPAFLNTSYRKTKVSKFPKIDIFGNLY